ncbi:hypothetical protein MKX01_007367 [Papaver californicum]|nr:hypothetical protein MKX01_007367 [Papaver californicum]
MTSYNVNKVLSPKNGEGNNEGKSSILSVVNGGGVEDVIKLENELFDYQYNMGLLLIEKKQRAKDLEEIRQALAVTNEKLKQEQMAHLIALSGMEKREQELRKAVGVEKQCVADLEKALHKMRAESAEVKYASDRKMEEAHALVLNTEDKSSELKMKLTATDAKFAEVNRTSFEMERKLKEVEARESAIRSEYHSFIAEREMHEVTLRKQKEELQAWERLLQEREERQLESWRILSQREDRGTENVMTLKQKLRDPEESQRNTDTDTLNLEKKEDDKNISLANLALKLEIDVAKKKLKEDELLATAEELNARETMEVQKLLSDADFQMEKRKKPSTKKLQSEVGWKDKKRRDSMHNEDKISNQEHELEKKVEKSPGQETKDLADKQLHNQIQNLNLSEEERNILYCLQAELEQERDKYIIQQELLLKDREDLKQERANFEKEWEMLDMKRDEIAKELKHASGDKELLINLKHIKQETWTNENMVTHDLKGFENERTTLAEKAQIEYENIVHHFEVLKRELEVDFNKRKQEIENHLSEQKKALEEEKEQELKKIDYIRELAGKEKEEMKEEWLKIEKEKAEVACNKKYIEEHQFEMQNYINNLDLIVKKLKDQRKEFVTLFVKLKNCESCGQVISQSILSDIQALQEMEYLDNLPLPRLKNKEIAHTGLGLNSVPTCEKTSWLRKCTSQIFNFSPLKRNENNPTKESHASIMEVVKKEAATGIDAVLNKTDLWLSSNTFDMQGIQLDDSVGASVHELSQYVDTYNKTQEGTNDVKQSKLKTGRGKPEPKGRPRVRKSQKVKDMTEDSNKDEFMDVNGEMEGSSNFPDKGSKTGKKRNYANASKTTINEQDVDTSENQSDDFGQGGRKKRLQTVVLALETPAKKRYNFRQPKNVAKAAANRTPNFPLPNFSKGKMKMKMKKTDNGTGIGEEVCIPGIVVDRFVGFTRENGASTPFVEPDSMEDHSLMEKSARVKYIPFLSCLPFKAILSFSYIYLLTNKNNFLKQVEFGEENDGGNSRSISVADTEYVYEDEISSEFSGEIVHGNDENWEADENDEEHLGVIIGRKLWTFFTT